MAFLSDLLLAAGAFAAAIYCLVLSRRLKALTALDSNLGSAIAVLSAQVDGLNASLTAAREAAQGSSGQLAAQADRAEAAGRRLEMLIASLHDLPEAVPESGLAGSSRSAMSGPHGGSSPPPRATPRADQRADRRAGWPDDPPEDGDADRTGDRFGRTGAPARGARILRRRQTETAA